MAKVKAASLVDAVGNILAGLNTTSLIAGCDGEPLVNTLADTLAEEKTETLFDTQ